MNNKKRYGTKQRSGVYKRSMRIADLIPSCPSPPLPMTLFSSPPMKTASSFAIPLPLYLFLLILSLLLFSIL